MNSKNLILTTVLLIAIFLSLWLVRNSFSTHVASQQNQPDTPDGFMTTAHYVRFDNTGAIASTLDSPKLVHYQKNDMTVFDQPRLWIINNTNKNQWTITALTGISKFGSTEVDLKKDVKLVRITKQNPNAPPAIMTITTSAMTAYPHKHFAQTDQPVTIIQPGSVINSVGMTANLASGDITLLSKAQGVYIPNVDKPSSENEATKK